MTTKANALDPSVGEVDKPGCIEYLSSVSGIELEADNFAKQARSDDIINYDKIFKNNILNGSIHEWK